MNNNSSFYKNKLFFPIVLFFAGFLIGIFVGVQYEGQKASQQLKKVQSQVPGPTPYAKQTLNKNYDFSIKDSNGKEVTKIKYILQDADLMNQILVSGQPYNSVSGKTFLILNIKLINASNQGIQIPTRDYVRLSVNKGQDWLAADIHNDPVQVQAISTKFTRIGFPIDSNLKNTWIQIGEVEGTKDLIKLNLK